MLRPVIICFQIFITSFFDCSRFHLASRFFFFSFHSQSYIMSPNPNKTARVLRSRTQVNKPTSDSPPESSLPDVVAGSKRIRAPSAGADAGKPCSLTVLCRIISWKSITWYLQVSQEVWHSTEQKTFTTALMAQASTLDQKPHGPDWLNFSINTQKLKGPDYPRAYPGFLQLKRLGPSLTTLNPPKRLQLPVLQPYQSTLRRTHSPFLMIQLHQKITISIFTSCQTWSICLEKLAWMAEVWLKLSSWACVMSTVI